MTINHLFLQIRASKFNLARTFYRTALKPLGYTELLAPHDGLVGFGSDYPYLWLKAVADGDLVRRVRDDGGVGGMHLAVQAQTNDQVNAFYAAALAAGGQENGSPHLHPEMSRQPYYSGFVIDPDGNNLEAVCVPTS